MAQAISLLPTLATTRCERLLLQPATLLLLPETVLRDLQAMVLSPHLPRWSCMNRRACPLTTAATSTLPTRSISAFAEWTQLQASSTRLRVTARQVQTGLAAEPSLATTRQPQRQD